MVLSCPFNGSFLLFINEYLNTLSVNRAKGANNRTFIPMLSYADGLLFRQIEALAETFNTAGRVKDALLPGEEWMTFRANVHLQDWLDTDGLK